MKLSNESQVVREVGFLNTIEAKLIGEFAANDTYSADKYFYEFKKEGSTFISLTQFNFCPVRLGHNMMLHRYSILTRTPKSYMVKYDRTLVFVKSIPNSMFHFSFVDEFLTQLPVRRVFPFRRSFFDDKLRCLDHIENRRDELLVLDDSDITQLRNYNFLLKTPFD